MYDLVVYVFYIGLFGLLITKSPSRRREVMWHCTQVFVTYLLHLL